MEGRASIRRRQFELAMRGNTALLIWWGKNNLGQADKMEKTESVDMTARASIEVLQAPDLQSVPDRRAALFRFEAFRRELAQTVPALPVPAEAA
jgi:hypothetical protein